MPNTYSRQWFEVFLETMPTDVTVSEVDGVCARLPLPRVRRVLDICCGPDTLDGARLTSTIEYLDGTHESMDWELFTPDAIAVRAAPFGFAEVERCTWWDSSRQPGADDQRYQVVLAKA